jgi:hypothetical protein
MAINDDSQANLQAAHTEGKVADKPSPDPSPQASSGKHIKKVTIEMLDSPPPPPPTPVQK